MQSYKKIIPAAVIAILIACGAWWGISHIGNTGKPSTRQFRMPKKPADPLKPAMDAYDAGKYKEAEAQAVKLVESAKGTNDPAKKKLAVRARYILAFSSARQKKMDEARDRFDVLKKEAAKLPDKGKQEPMANQPQPTLEEEGAYQHAVCTAALGDKKAAEAEFMKIIKDYPESPMVHASIKRIQWLHNGRIPPEAEQAWQKATQIARKREEAREKEFAKQMSLCGPECLAELLHRRGEKVDVKTLTQELKTTENGTTLLALVETAKKHGIKAKGVSLTQKGLLKQPLPMITLIDPGHYVVVEEVSPTEVKIWDAYGQGINKPGRRSIKLIDWETQWSGVAMVSETSPQRTRRDTERI